MNKLMNLCIVSIALSLIASCKNAPDSDKAKTTEAKEETTSAAGENYKVDTGASKIEWIGTKVSGYHTGAVKIKDGELTVANGVLTGGKFVLDMTTIAATGPEKVSNEMSAKLTGHLHTEDFFDVAKFPEAIFIITGITPFSGTVNDSLDPRQEKLNEYKVTDPTHTISGNLTIKGVTKNIEFPARVTIADNSIEAKAKFNINRKQWNIAYTGKPDDLIRDEVYLGILLKAVK
jgi:polyisoprenoid-binding protein YceI